MTVSAHRGGCSAAEAKAMDVITDPTITMGLKPKLFVRAAHRGPKNNKSNK